MPDQADIPEHLCGGTYRRARGRKRKRGAESSTESLTYAERQQKRIARKFGKHGDGNALGEDDLVRGALEQGHRHYGKPKVAQSKRGRELRANAALARFEQAKRESRATTAEAKSEPLDSETESEWSQDEDEDGPADGMNSAPKIKDEQGHDLVRICGDEGGLDEGGANEMSDLRTMRETTSQPTIELEDLETASEDESEPEKPHVREKPDRNTSPPLSQPNATPETNDDLANSRTESQTTESTKTTTHGSVIKCPICSLENELSSPTCIACAHVLKPGLVRDSWRCTSQTCRGTKYINAGDAGICGICGSPRPPTTNQLHAAENNPSNRTGVVSNDVLRWD